MPGKQRLPFSFDVAKGSAVKILLVVEGFDNEDAQAPVIERKLITAFKDGVTRELVVNLADSCANRWLPVADLRKSYDFNAFFGWRSTRFPADS